MPIRRAAFDLFLCLSLANLWFLRVWAQLLPAVVNRSNLYYMDAAPRWIHYPATLVSLFAVGSVAAAIVAWGRRNPAGWPGRVSTATWVLLFAVGGIAIVGQFPEESRASALQRLTVPGAWTLAVAAAAILLALLRFRRAWVLGAIEIAAIFASPFLLMTVGQTVWTAARHDPAHFAGSGLADGRPAEPRAGAPPRAVRVVWVVFDELDQHAVFEARPDSLALPELDRLATESLVAQNAFAPARETRRSMASLLLGRQVETALPSDATRLPCTLGDGETSADCWSAYDSIFEKLHQRGFDSGVAGWYHPYCRLFAASLVRCQWSGLAYWNSDRIAESFDQQWHEVVKSLPWLRDRLRPGTRIRGEHRHSFSEIRSAALALVADARLDFVLVHLPVPHHPDIYDPARRSLSIEDARSYFDNLALTDRTLGEIRHSLENSGLWDRTTVVVTSDHWWRAIHRGDWGLTAAEEAVFEDGVHRRVPFLLKLAGSATSAHYARPFNTRLLHDLTLAIFDGTVADLAGVVNFLDLTRRQAPVPYLEPADLRRFPAAFEAP